MALVASQAEKRSSHNGVVPMQSEELVPSASVHSSWKYSLLISTAMLSALLAFFSSASVNWRTYPQGDSLLSNGTHDFGRTVVLVSIDGLRSDYLTRGLTPHLIDIIREGVRAEYMKPIFPHRPLRPAITDSNHWTLLTGLYSESHGIIANDFYDPQLRSVFACNRPESDESRWWFGEPLWETVERAGLHSANIMWPGPRMTTSGVSPAYHVPFKLNYRPEERIAQVLEWVDLPLEERPRLILVYEPMLDQAGHAYGPESKLVNETLLTMSEFAHTLVQGLYYERNLSHIVDLLIVSDHGMEDTSSWNMVYMDDILCSEEDAREQGWPACWPSMGLWFKPGISASAALSRLVIASESGQFDSVEKVAPPAMPERYHYTSSPRLAPVWIVPRIGYALTDRVENGSLMSIGNHGYDNDESSMRAVFIARGPFAESARKRLREDHNRIDEYVLPPFPNVELYNLVLRLLGIEEWASETNGTKGFWDTWI
ncbi:Phosphodiest-domain-containing protein [Melanogaster broomeanus]|nr:Phosphodiest-domain-containing protein [Melanogaster broomeanus]